MYTKPIIIEADSLSEGVFAASGDGSFIVTATPKGTTLKHGKWVWDIDFIYSGSSECKNQSVTITFNQNVTDFVANDGTLSGSNSGSVFTFTMSETFKDGAKANYQISCTNPVNPEVRPTITGCSATVA